jgi:hypothetical protein
MDLCRYFIYELGDGVSIGTGISAPFHSNASGCGSTTNEVHR